MTLSSTISATHAAPADQPTGVSQITERLFPAYTITEGAVHLAGCLLEDRIFVRLGFRAGEQSVEIYVDGEGREIDDALVQKLGMPQTVPLSTPPEPMDPEISRLIECGTRLIDDRTSVRPQQLSATILWCKFAEGKLRFTVGEHAEELPFSGWARTLKPPPFVCPHTGQSTFHLAATDDGRIAAAEQIEVCAESGRRLLSDDLVTCSATGRRVAAELTATCPVTGQRFLGSQTVPCATCQQDVSPTAVEKNECAACRQLQSVTKADPRMARLLDEYPPLDRWSKWRISETATVYVVTAAGLLKRLLVVVDKESLELKLLATGNRFFSGWNVVEPAQYEYELRE